MIDEPEEDNSSKVIPAIQPENMKKLIAQMNIDFVLLLC
jgi:hypothetical protein